MVSVFAPLIAVRFSPQAFVFSLGRLLVFHVKVADTFSLFCFSLVVLFLNPRFWGLLVVRHKRNRERAVVNAAAPCWRYVKHKVEMSSSSVKMLSPLRLCFF